MAERYLEKRACQKCEYLNPRQALYCLRCGEIFRPVLAETPWEYLSPEREQKRAEALGKAALEKLQGAAGGPSWGRLFLSGLLLASIFFAVFSWNLHRRLHRYLASDPSVVTEAIWKAHRPQIERPKRPFMRPKPAARTMEDGYVAAWLSTAGAVGFYLMALGLLGVLRGELRPARWVAPLDVFYPWGAFWSELMAGRRVSRPSWRRMAMPLLGAPAVLVGAAYWFWGLATITVLPAAVYYAELQVEGWERGLKALGLDLPPSSRLANQGLWAGPDGTLRLLVESGLKPGVALEFYGKRWSVPRDASAARVSGPAPDGGRYGVVALDPSPAEEARGVASLLTVSLTGSQAPAPVLTE